jgi:hypothetical protein
MAIDKPDFAKECVRQGLSCGINPHYVVGVAQLRSGIAEGTDGNKIGPFRLTQADWNAHCNDSTFGLAFLPQDINDPDMQIPVFPAMARLAFDAFAAANSRNPSAMELYHQQFPDAPTATLPADLKTALDATADLINSGYVALLGAQPAAGSTIADPGQPLPGGVRISGPPIPKGREAMAQKIVAAFALKGLGKFQQAAGLANAIAESKLDPDAHASKGEDSFGLFQLNRNGGLGKGHDPSELTDPEANIRIVLAEAMRHREFTQAASLDQAVSAFVSKVEIPRDIPKQIALRLGIARQLI